MSRENLGLDDLRSAIEAFIKERDWEQSHSPKNLAMALSVEVAEIVEHFQWLTEKRYRSCRSGSDDANHGLLPINPNNTSLPPSGGPAQVGATPGLEFWAELRTDGEVGLAVAL